jgi:hypothetical protein
MARVKDFRPATRNANKHTARGLGALQTSIQTDGWIGAMTTAADGEMIAGSARIETVAQVWGVDAEPIVVQSDGSRPIVVMRTDIPNAQDKRAQRLALADNRVAELDLSFDVAVLADMAADVLGDLWTAEELSSLDDYEHPRLRETEETLRPRPMFLALVSVPIDGALDLHVALAELAQLPGVEVLYGANDEN